MRILYSHRIGSRDGQAVHLEAMVAALRAAGHEVRVVGPASFDATGLGGENRLVAWLRRRMPAWVGEVAEIAYAIPATWRLDRAAADFAPHAIYERANLFHFAGTLVAWRRALPLLLEVNAPLAEERARFGGLALKRIAAAGERWVWRRATQVLPVTAVLAAHLRAAGVQEARIAVTPNGINLEDYPEALRTTPVRDAPVVLGFIGFLRGWHGLDGVLRSLAASASPVPLVLHVAGEGPAGPDLQALAAELGLGARLRLAGLVARANVPATLSGFDIALQPAAVPYACPLKVLEYMAAGCAIVAPDQPNIRELLEHERTALLFAPTDPEGVWQAVRRLAEDAPLRHRLGAAARAEITARDLTWAALARRVVALAEQPR